MIIKFCLVFPKIFLLHKVVRDAKKVEKHWCKRHSSMRQSNLQLQNETALMSCRIRAVEHRKSAAGLAGAHPNLQDRVLLNHTRIENAHNVRKKTFEFLLFRGPTNFLFSLFPAETLSNAWVLLCWKRLFLSSCNSSIMLQKLIM